MSGNAVYVRRGGLTACVSQEAWDAASEGEERRALIQDALDAAGISSEAQYHAGRYRVVP